MKKLALLSLISLPLATLAEDREWISYKTLIEDRRLDRFYAIPAAERDKLNLFVTIRPVNQNMKPSDVNLTVASAAGRQALPIAPDGRLSVVPNPKWISEDAKIWTNVPKGEKTSLGWDITTPLPEGVQWSYAAVMSSLDQSNRAIKKMAGALSLFVPKTNMVILKFARPAQLSIQSKDGVKLYTSDTRGQIKLKPDAALMKENPLMVASERPFEAELETD